MPPASALMCPLAMIPETRVGEFVSVLPRVEMGASFPEHRANEDTTHNVLKILQFLSAVTSLWSSTAPSLFAPRNPTSSPTG
jgi:hypothetical protein